MLIAEETPVDAPPEEVFAFFQQMDEDHYRAWHPDHITFRWVEGAGLEEGNVAYFEEEIGGELKKLKVRYQKVEPGRYIEFSPTSRLIRLVMPHISFTIEPEDSGCRVTQRLKIRTGPIGRWLNRREFEAVRRHMKEEGENLKRIVEEGIRA